LLVNCPKYLNKKEIHPAVPEPELIASGPSLTDDGFTLLKKADLFFMSTSNAEIDMDTNHRGGPPGFIRALSKNVIVYPEYSGNRLYQSLGNLISTPAIGIAVPDFETGDVLYITGTTEILTGDQASELLPRTNLAVKITLLDSRLVRKGLSFRGSLGELSPYNPPVRLLVSEGSIAAAFESKPEGTTTLVDKEELTPSIARYRFRASHQVKYKPGQWVALDFSDELDIGYSHMRDDDPASLNDDFIRTFTVSSHPGDLPDDEFEITVRLHGPVTALLKKQRPSSRHPLEVKLRGFGGDFKLSIPQGQEVLPFVAGGVGITPLLGQLKELDIDKVRLIWIVRTEDLEFVRDILKRYPALRTGTSLFITGKSNPLKIADEVDSITKLGTTVRMGRPTAANEIEDIIPGAQTWYLCAGQQLRKQLLEWFRGKKVESENFDY
jgi:NAD(P)H-flavin reductase